MRGPKHGHRVKVSPRVSILKLKKKRHLEDFPVDPVVKNLPSNARDIGSIPGQGTKIPHAVGQLTARVTQHSKKKKKKEAFEILSLD